MRTRMTVLTALAATAIFVAGLVVAAYELGQQAGPGSAPAVGGDLTTVAELYRHLTRDAVGAPQDDALIEGALRGMLEQLDDPYARYYDAAAYTEFNDVLEGRFSGIGLLLEETPQGPEVVRVLPDTPAEEQGVETGERIVSVDGRDVRDEPIDVIVGRVTGDAGTKVTVGFEGGSKGPREITFTRREIDLPITQAELLADGIGYVELLTFTPAAAEQVRADIEQLLEEGAEGIVFDLRGNPGGLLDEAVEVASVFVENEVIVSVRGADGRMRELRADSRDAFTDLPLVVLVDDTSASASEIVAGALQDHDRAELVGTVTFGKGTVQTVRDLPDGAGVKFTTAEYLTPAGRSIEGSGLRPDRQVEDPEAQLEVATEALRERIAAMTLDPAA